MKEAVRLYRDLLRHSVRLSSYNFRQYAVRRIRDAYLSNRGLTDQAQIDRELSYGHEQLNLLKRQATISQMYKEDRLVVETAR